MSEINASVEFNLLNHQDKAVSGVDSIYSEGNRFAGVKLPTGGGKSFVAMMEILKAAGNDFSSKTNDGIVNDASIIYVAPTNEILFQIQSNIAEFILKKDVDKMERSEIIETVRKAFPNLSLKCYATLLSESKKGELEVQDPDFIILDEAHRSGASGWQQAVAELVGCKIDNGEPVFDSTSTKKSKVLAISATPERDVDGKNMMDLWAAALDNLTPEQIKAKEHIGMDLDLDTAVREGIVVQPEVIHFDANLVTSPEYKRLVELHASATGKLKDSLRKRLDKVNTEVIGIPNYDTLSPQEQEKAILARNIEVMVQAIKDGKIPDAGKMILFTPENRAKDGEEKPSFPEFFAGKEAFIREMLESAGLDIDARYLSCSLTDSENEVNLNEFNKPVGELSAEDRKSGRTNPADYKVIMATDKLNEGIHAKGITNSFMLRNMQEGENTNQRAQTIMFLQQIGRTVFSILPGKDVKRPVIFDYANNFFTQNRDNPRKDKIEIFELTETQAMLIKEAREATLECYKATAPINQRLPRLMDTLRILREYRFGPNNDIEFNLTSEKIGTKTTLEELLEVQPLVEKKDEILQRLIDEGLYTPKKAYVIGKDFYDAKAAFWKGTKCMEEYSLEEIVASGIIDTKSGAGMAELMAHSNKDLVDVETGFIKMGASMKFRNMNIYTGTEFDMNGRDVDGLYPGQFDEMGYDAEGFDRYGFNSEGIHKVTNTIHDKRGFMANGINIQTGTELDLLGYNRQEIKPVYDTVVVKVPDSEENITKKVLVGGWDKEGYWHLPNEAGEFGCRVSKYSEGYEPRQDVHGFDPKGKHISRGGRIDWSGFYKDGVSMSEYMDDSGTIHRNRNKEGRDIDGFDEYDFDVAGIHRDTGTRLNSEDRPFGLFTKAALEIKSGLDRLSAEMKFKIFKLQEDGMFRLKGKDGDVLRKHNVYNFNAEGINAITGLYTDEYGFTMADYHMLKDRQKSNEFGFKPYEVPKNIAGVNPRELYKISRVKGRTFKCNILGTDERGMTVDGEKHPALQFTAEYIEKCVKSGMSKEEFMTQYAIEHKMLVPEVKRLAKTSFVQAVTLYRICPELQKTSEVAKDFYSAEPSRVQAFIKGCPGLQLTIKRDIAGYVKELDRIKGEQEKQAQITNPREVESAKARIESLKKQNHAVRQKIEKLKDIPGMEL